MAKTYEMLWDCAFCGQKKLLGKTHRHCPSCGAAQDPTKRYFPEEQDKVAVEDHVFVGADRTCPACSTPNSAKASHCVNCGSAMDGAQHVALKVDPRGSEAAADPSEAHASRAGALTTADPTTGGAAEAGIDYIRPGVRAHVPKKSNRKRDLLILFGVLSTLVGGGWCLLRTEERPVRVVGHSWNRTIGIEELGPVSDSAWCDSMPGDAYSVSRSRQVRSHRQIADGEDCHTVRTDNGDGTYSESESCTTRYRQEPVYDDHCSYTVDRWHVVREAKASGASLAETPVWPPVNLRRPGSCKGCEREGARKEVYSVRFVGEAESDGEKPSEYGCDLPQTRWQGFAVDSEWVGDVGVVTDILMCDSLRTPGAPTTR